MDPSAIFESVQQHGYLGIAAVQLVLLTWLVRRMLEMTARVADVIAANTLAIEKIDERTIELTRLTGGLRNRLLARPCISREERIRA